MLKHVHESSTILRGKYQESVSINSFYIKARWQVLWKATFVYEMAGAAFRWSKQILNGEVGEPEKPKT